MKGKLKLLKAKLCASSSCPSPSPANGKKQEEDALEHVEEDGAVAAVKIYKWMVHSCL
ncbi:hypothetical protein PtB15_17B414 [Puccinia triticina]|nr:hypothetical protein PtB15_17B414 [Puccinia triticina]